MCEVPICGRTKSTLGIPSSCGNQEEKKKSYMYKTKQKKKKVLHIWACSHGWECDKQAVSVLAVCMCVRVCECASWNLNGQYTDMSTYIHTHTENNGWKKSVKATSSDSQGNTTRSVERKRPQTVCITALLYNKDFNKNLRTDSYKLVHPLF